MRTYCFAAIALSAAALSASSAPRSTAVETTSPVPSSTNIAGIVTSTKGPEAGVWVIAETHDLPTKFVRIVVTDDEGRYLIPDLPRAKYSVWVRGYGLVDSPKSIASPAQTLNLRATLAPTARAAAYYYPAGYWFSLLKVPAASEFPGTGPTGNGISPRLKSQADWIRTIKSGTCLGCHQLGSIGTRTISPALGTFSNSVAAWERRVQSGQAGPQMLSTILARLPYTGATASTGRARPMSTTPCSTRVGACGSRPPFDRPTIRRSAKRDTATRRPRHSRWRAPADNWPCTTRRPRGSRTSARATARII